MVEHSDEWHAPYVDRDRKPSLVLVNLLADLAPSMEPSYFTDDEWRLLPRISVDVEEQVFSESLEARLREHGRSTPHPWWLATVQRSSSGGAQVLPLAPAPGYGVTVNGRLVMDMGYRHLTVAELVRALDEGSYGDTDTQLALVPPPEVGGNGFIGQTLVEWFIDNSPEVLFGYLAAKAGDLVLSTQDRKLQRLAADWAAQRIDSPFQLRTWIEKKGEWFPDVLARRLSLSTVAAEELLRQLGYEKNQKGLMLRRNTPENLWRRQAWLNAEHGRFPAEFYESEFDADGLPLSNRFRRVITAIATKLSAVTESLRAWRRR